MAIKVLEGLPIRAPDDCTLGIAGLYGRSGVEAQLLDSGRMERPGRKWDGLASQAHLGL